MLNLRHNPCRLATLLVNARRFIPRMSMKSSCIERAATFTTYARLLTVRDVSREQMKWKWIDRFIPRWFYGMQCMVKRNYSDKNTNQGTKATFYSITLVTQCQMQRNSSLTWVHQVKYTVLFPILPHSCFWTMGPVRRREELGQPTTALSHGYDVPTFVYWNVSPFSLRLVLNCLKSLQSFVG